MLQHDPHKDNQNKDVVQLSKPKEEDGLKHEEVVFGENKGSFGISPKEIQEIIYKYDTRNFCEEIELLTSIGGNQGIEKLLKTNLESGLTTNEEDHKERLEIYGSNALEQEPLPHCCEYVWEALGDLMLRILMIASIIQIGLGASPLSEHPEKDWVEGLSIIIAVFVVSSVGSTTNYSKEKKFKELNDRNASMVKITIRRNGESYECSPDDILVGDLIKVVTGSIIPADGILIATEGQIKIEESSLTGESDLIDKDTIDTCVVRSKEFVDKEVNKHSVPSPLIFSGTQVKEGNGWFLAWAVGNSSKKGQIQQQVQQNKENDDSKTPLEIKLDEIASDIGYFGMAAGIFTLIALLIRFGVIFKDKKASYEDLLNNPIDGVIAQNPNDSASNDVIKIFLLCIAVVVVAIPEGLPLAVTLSLAFSIGNMMDDMNLVRRMHACETMGGANFICTDKTGTLTANIMNVFQLYDGVANHDLREVTETINTRKDSANYFKPQYYELLCEALCCNLQMTVTENDTILDPSKTDLAFANILHNFDTKLFPIQTKFRVNEHHTRRIPFSSQRKKMTTIVSHPDFPTGHRAYMKGASEIVLNSVTKYLNPSDMSILSKSDEDNERLKQVIKTYADQTLRTICVAYKDIQAVEAENYQVKDDQGNNIVENTGFTMVCISGIKDTLRKGVTEAIKKCHGAGITVIMVTGDLKDTAVAISKECGIWALAPDAQIPEYYSLTGEEFFKKIGGLECELCNKDIKDCPCPKTKKEAETKNIDESLIQRQRIKDMEAFKTIAKDLRVLARSRPLDKYALVMGLRKLDFVVAVTGDGTNDAQALSKSDVGFAMGIEGTDVAKDAADIIILDDNFASIVKAVVWGRNIYDCIRKFMLFQLTVNVVACTLVFLTACIGNETPITAVQMLWLNLIMDSLGSLSLATEPPHDEILQRKPNSKREYIISSLMMKFIIGHSIFLLALLLAFYLKAPDFLGEYNHERIQEAEILHTCYGRWPGRGPKINDDGSKFYYVMSGSQSAWPADNYLVKGVTSMECGSYANSQEMSAAFKEYKAQYGNTSHMTVIFNIFVLYSLFNQFNARVITNDVNIFYNLSKNFYFVIIVGLEFVFQALIIEFGANAIQTSIGGLHAKQWGYCIGFALLTFPVSVVLKFSQLEHCIDATMAYFKGKCGSKKVDDEEKENINENYDSNKPMIKNNSEPQNKPIEKVISRDRSSRRKSLVEGIHPSNLQKKQSSKMRQPKEEI